MKNSNLVEMKPKYLTEAHRINSEAAMKKLTEQKLPLDFEKCLAELRENSKDHPVSDPRIEEQPANNLTKDQKVSLFIRILGLKNAIRKIRECNDQLTLQGKPISVGKILVQEHIKELKQALKKLRGEPFEELVTFPPTPEQLNAMSPEQRTRFVLYNLWKRKFLTEIRDDSKNLGK